MRVEPRPIILVEVNMYMLHACMRCVCVCVCVCVYTHTHTHTRRAF
jgi:hypothetical protein